jgi:hypothetical protein
MARLDLNDYDKLVRSVWDRVGIFVVVAVVIFEIAAAYSGLGYNNFYDEGVYLQSARMMIRGYHLYSSVFDSQPPLWLPSIYCSFRLFGLNMSVAQSTVAVMAIVATIAAALATRQLAGWGAAGLAAATVAFSPMEVWLARVSPEVPAIAMGTAAIALSIYYVRGRSLITLCLAAILVACSILFKLLGLFTLPAVILMIGTSRWADSGIGRQKIFLFLRDTLIVLGIVTVLIVGSMLAFGPLNVWRQAVEFHWSAARADSISQQIESLGAVIFAFGLPCALALLSILSIYAIPEGLALIGWIFFTTVGLLYLQPLFSHHMIVLIPPIAIAGAVGWARLAEVAERLRHRWDRDLSVLLTNSFVMLVDTALILLVLATFGVHTATIVMNPTLSYRPDFAAAQMIDQLTTADEQILTDAQGIAFLANRDVPPELADTSFRRIVTGYLTFKDVVTYSDRYHVRLVLLWSGRLASIPGMKQWVSAHFPYHLALGENRDLYTLLPLGGCHSCEYGISR